jgi:hypothetical protein
MTGAGLMAGAGCWFSPCLMIRFRRTSITCSAGRDAARVEARVLPVAAVSMAKVDDSAARAASTTVATGGPASVGVEDEDEVPPWGERVWVG